MTWLNGLARLFRRSRTPTPGMRVGLGYRRSAGVPVTEENAYTVSAFWACVRVISETIGQMPWRVYRNTRTGGFGRELASDHPADRLLNLQPNYIQDAVTWRELMLRHVLTWGNGYSEIVRDRSFRPIELWPIEPWRVEPRIEGGALWYQVMNPGGDKVDIPAADMLHFRGMGDELVGWSVIWYMAKVLGLSVAQEDSMASQMEHGARLSGLLRPPGGGRLPPERAKNIEAEWNAQNTGSRKHGKVVLLSEGVDFTAIAQPNTDAQMLESRQFSVLDVCRFFRVPPHMVYELTRATFSNITHQGLEFLIHTLGPWTVKLEQQAGNKLLSNRREFSTELDATSILRMDPDTRTKYFRELWGIGAINLNEIRQREGLNPLGPDGDLHFVPVNMQTLEQAASEPDSEPEPEPPDPEPEPGLILNDEGDNNGRGVRIRAD